MKIVAKISDSKFLVELDESELNRITNNDRSSYYQRPYKAGESFDITKIWKYFKPILEKKKELSVTARNLRAMADMIESMPIPDEKSLDDEMKKTVVNEQVAKEFS